jgi:hypothetical protein
MGTRSYIFTETQNDNFLGSYCHWDGYPEGVGVRLLNNYTNQDQVNEVCNLGGFSTLQDTVVETAKSQYNDQPVAEVNNGKDALEYGDMVDYIYVYEDNNWWFYETSYGEGPFNRRHLETYLSMKND